MRILTVYFTVTRNYTAATRAIYTQRLIVHGSEHLLDLLPHSLMAGLLRLNGDTAHQVSRGVRRDNIGRHSTLHQTNVDSGVAISLTAPKVRL
jgi:hypothetical protein